MWIHIQRIVFNFSKKCFVRFWRSSKLSKKSLLWSVYVVIMSCLFCWSLEFRQTSLWLVFQKFWGRHCLNLISFKCLVSNYSSFPKRSYFTLIPVVYLLFYLFSPDDVWFLTVLVIWQYFRRTKNTFELFVVTDNEYFGIFADLS